MSAERQRSRDILRELDGQSTTEQHCLGHASIQEMDSGWRMMKQKNSIHEEVSACHAVACDDAVVKACWACAIVRIEFSRCLSGVRSLEG